MKTINCAECNKEVQYEPVKGYPDKRKYCFSCSEKKKQTWEAKTEPTVSGTTTMEANVETVPMNNEVRGIEIADVIENVKKQVVKAKEFHLSPELIRSNALECAISFSAIKKFDNIGDIKNLAEDLESWIKNSK